MENRGYINESSKVKRLSTVVNLSSAKMRKSLLNAIEDKVASIQNERMVSTTTTKTLNLAPGGLGGTGETQTVTIKSEIEPVESLFRLIKGSPTRPSVLVLDNFETVVGSEDIVNEISNIIMLLDDEDMGKYYVKICIVGVPAEISDYLSRQTNRTTITSRLTEIREVSRLSHDEARQILERGFEDLLKYTFKSLIEIINIFEKILDVTDRIAAEVQDLALKVALRAQSNDKVIELLVVEDAIEEWILSSYNAARLTIVERMNSISGTKIGRRSQCLYALGQLTLEDFRRSDVEGKFKECFPSTKGKNIGVGKLLQDLCSGENAPIRKLHTGDGYRFSHPKYRMVIRAILVVREGERVDRKRAEL